MEQFYPYIIIFLALLALFVFSSILKMPKSFYNNENRRKLFRKEKREEKEDDLF